MLDYGKKTYIMGILNVTPDSFSDGGDFTNIDIAVNHAKEMIKLGADMIDLGGESTRPGHKFVSAEEEISRIVPVIKRLKEEIAHYELKDLVLSAKLVNNISIIDKIYNDKDTKYISKLANKITEEDNKIVLFALINGDRVNLVFSCSKNLNFLDMNSLLKDAIKLIDGNGGGNKFNAQGGGKNNSNLESLINYTLMKLQNELD